MHAIYLQISEISELHAQSKIIFNILRPDLSVF